MSAAARLRRLDEAAEIIVLERSGHVSFANCGLPYFVGGVIEDEDDLTLQTPEQLFRRFRLDVRVEREVVAIDRDAHSVSVRSTRTGEVTGHRVRPARAQHGSRTGTAADPGIRARSDPADRRRRRGPGHRGRRPAPEHAVVIGAGFIGLEVAENLVARGIDVVIVEAAPQVLPPLDPELAILLADELAAHGVRVETGATVVSIGAARRDAGRRPFDRRRPGGRCDRCATRCRARTGGRSRARSERRYRGRRREPHQRPRYLRGRRRRREARRRLRARPR